MVVVAQSCPTLCDPMDCNPPDSSVHGIFQIRILELVVIPFSRGSSHPRDWTWVSRIMGRFFTAEQPGKCLVIYLGLSLPLEKAMAPHSNTLAWKIPRTEEPDGLQSMGLLRVGHDWATSLSLFTFMHWRRKWQPTPGFLPGESRDGGAWWATVYGDTQSWSWLKRLSSSSSLPCGSDGKASAYNVGKPGFDSWDGRIPWRRK